LPRLRLYLEFERILSENELEVARQLVKRRGEREPLQHILGSASFCGLELKVTKDVLIPRPETEVLAERSWLFLQDQARSKPGGVSALDFGTGSGCLAIALACHVPAAHVIAVDASRPALEIARENAARHQVLSRIEFLEVTRLPELPGTPQFDLIVSNPPYVPTEEIEHLMPEVRDHDPRLALDGGRDGMDYFRLLAVEAPSLLAPGGKLMCEFGDGQAKSVAQLFSTEGWKAETIEGDLSGRPRVLVVSRAGS
jgi:release factor glutamine methyltransferase